MRGGDGFTLIEVVVAGGLLAIGVLALVTLQLEALQAQRRVKVVRQLVAVAEAELERQLALPLPAAGNCAVAESSTLESCGVEVEGCHISEEGLCGSTDSRRATRVVVTVAAASQEFVLAALHGVGW